MQNTMARGGGMVPGKKMKNDAVRKKKEKGKGKGESDQILLFLTDRLEFN